MQSVHSVPCGKEICNHCKKKRKKKKEINKAVWHMPVPRLAKEHLQSLSKNVRSMLQYIVPSKWSQFPRACFNSLWGSISAVSAKGNYFGEKNWGNPMSIYITIYWLHLAHENTCYSRSYTTMCYRTTDQNLNCLQYNANTIKIRVTR